MHDNSPEIQSHHHDSVRTSAFVYFALLILLALTIGAAYVDFGRLNIIITLTIAVVKALLIILYFMHLQRSDRLTQIAAGSGFLWLFILILLTVADYLNRTPPT